MTVIRLLKLLAFFIRIIKVIRVIAWQASAEALAAAIPGAQIFNPNNSKKP